MHFEFAINPAPAAAFVIALEGAGGSIGARRIRLQRAPGSNMLAASTSGFGTADCSPPASGVWSKVALDVRTDRHSFDVSIDGHATACTNGATQIAVPFSGVSIMDASNDGWGGDVQFDDIALSGSAAPPCISPLTPPQVVLDRDFDTDPLGDLVAPWSVTPNPQRASTLRVVNAAAGGRALQLQGATASGEFAIGQRPFDASATQTDVRFDFAVRPDRAASFVVALNGAGASLGARRIRLQRAPNSTSLVADTAGSSNLSCGTLESNTWSNISLLVHTASTPHRFDVQINGASTACQGASTGLGAPFTSVSVMDASNTGWGGSVLFDDFLVTASGAPTGSCP